MKLNPLSIFLLFILTASSLNAQTSWREESKKITNDVERFSWLADVFHSKPEYVDEKADILKEIFTITTALNIDTLTGTAHLLKASYYQQAGYLNKAWTELETAKRYFKKAKHYDYLGRAIYSQCTILINQDNADSLLIFIESNKAVYDLMKSPSLKLYIRAIKASAYQTNGNYEYALLEYRNLLPLSIEIADTSLIVSTLINLAMMQESFDSSLYYLKQGLVLTKDRFMDKHGELLVKLGFKYHMLDDVRKDSSLHYYLEAKKYIKFFRSPSLKLQIYNHISDFFITKTEYDLALPNLQEAYAESKFIGGKGKSITTHNLALCFYFLNQNDSAKIYLDEFENDIKPQNDPYQWMLFYQLKSNLLANTGGRCNHEVLKTRLKALEYAKTINELRVTYTILKTISDCILDEEETKVDDNIIKSVLTYFKAFHPIYKKSENLFNYRTFLNWYAKMEAKYGNPTKALEIYKEHSELIDRIEKEQYKLGHDEALVKYKSALKDQEIEYTRKKNFSLTIGAVIISVALIVVILVWYRTIRLNQRINAQKTELQNLNMVKDRLFSVISHDLRTPVSSLLSFMYLLEINKIPEHQLPTFIAELKKQLTHTTGLLDNLLNWAHSQMKGKEPKITELNLNALSNDVVKLYSNEAEKKNITIKNTIPEDYVIMGDANMTSLILRNLIGNAIKFTPEGKNIIIAPTSSNNLKGFSVTDQGVGITAELVKSFNSTQLETVMQSTLGTANEKGTGLGLMLCKTYIAQMGGNIVLTSEPNQGSSFNVLFTA